jgi:hypothetical protein
MYLKMSKFILLEYGRDSLDWRRKEMAVIHLSQNE